MSDSTGIGASSHYFATLFAVLRRQATQLVRPASPVRRAEAARKVSRQVLLLLAIAAVAVPALMFEVDVAEIQLMPPRGAPGLWPVRILTDFGRDVYVLWALVVMLIAVMVTAPWLRGQTRSRLLGFATQLQFLFLAVLMPLLAGEVIKWMAGRGRPFVGGQANAFNFVPFAGTEAHASFPSAHAITGFALAFAVTALWPRAGIAMAVYAVLIALSRLVLLAHHPSDVVAGALIGLTGAMVVRYWFAARGLCFAIGDDGAIVPAAGHAGSGWPQASNPG
jgi:membrane-associated phospholipid phosphatase